MQTMLASARGRGRVSESIVRRIKDGISKGRLTAGHRLPAEREMARQFKTSRVSVREAYRSLEELGVLRIRRGADGGAFIMQVDHEPVLRSLALVLGLGKTPHQQLTEARMPARRRGRVRLHGQARRRHPEPRQAQPAGALNATTYSFE